MQSVIENITYADLVARFGQNGALGLVRTVEKLAKIRGDVIPIDQDVRFTNALVALNEIDFT